MPPDLATIKSAESHNGVGEAVDTQQSGPQGASASEVGFDFDMSEALGQAVEAPSVVRACCVLEEKVAEIKALRQEQMEQQRSGGSADPDVIARINEKEATVRQQLDGLPKTEDVKHLLATLEPSPSASAAVDAGVARDSTIEASNAVPTREPQKGVVVAGETQQSSLEGPSTGAPVAAMTASEPVTEAARQESISSSVSIESSVSGASESAVSQTAQAPRSEQLDTGKLSGAELGRVVEKLAEPKIAASREALRSEGTHAESSLRQDAPSASGRVEPSEGQQARPAAELRSQAESFISPRESSPSAPLGESVRQGAAVASTVRPAEPAAALPTANTPNRARENSAQAPKQTEPMRRVERASKPELQITRVVRSAPEVRSSGVARSTPSRLAPKAGASSAGAGPRMPSGTSKTAAATARATSPAGKPPAPQKSGVQRTAVQPKVDAVRTVRASIRQRSPAPRQSRRLQATLKRAGTRASTATRRSRLGTVSVVASKSFRPAAQGRIQALVRQLRTLSPKEIKNLLKASAGRKPELRAAVAIKQRSQRILARVKDRPIKEVLRMRGFKPSRSERARKAERLLSDRERMARREVRSHLRGLEQRLKTVLNPRSLIYRRLTTELTPSDLERLVSILGGARAMRGFKRRQKSGKVSSVVEADVSGSFMRELSAAAGAAGKASSSSGESEGGGAGGAGAEQGGSLEASANQESTLVADGATPTATLTTFIMKEEDQPSSPAAQ